MRRAVVVGAGGAGRETAAWYMATVQEQILLGFVDDDDSIMGEIRAGFPILGGLTWLATNAVDHIILGVGTPSARRDITSRLVAMGLQLTTVVHPTAVIGPGVIIEAGAVISPGVVLTRDVHIGQSAYINYAAAIGHDTTIGAYTVVAPGAMIAGNVDIGVGVDFGIAASILQGLTIAEGAVIGGGACVTHNISAGQLAVGLPAKPVKRR